MTPLVVPIFMILLVPSFFTNLAWAAVNPIFASDGTKMRLSIQDTVGKIGDARRLFELLKVEAQPGQQVLDKIIESDDQRFVIFCEKANLFAITVCAIDVLAGPDSSLDSKTQSASYRVGGASAKKLHSFLAEPGSVFEYTTGENPPRLVIRASELDFEFFLTPRL